MRALFERRTERGLGKLTILVFGTIAAVVGYCAYHIIPFFYYFYELRSHMEQVIKVADVENDTEIRRRLMYHIKKYELPAEPESLVIERDGRHMKISLPYDEIFYVTWQGKDYDLYVFHFHAYAEGNF